MLHRWNPVPSIQRLLAKGGSRQFLKYGMVGVFNTAFGLGVFTLLVYLLRDRIPYGYLVANALSSVLSITVAFFLYKWIVFKTKGNTLREWMKCMAVYGSAIALGTAVLPLLVWFVKHLPHVDERRAPYLAGYLWTFLSVFYNFIGNKKFSFKQKKVVEEKATPTAL